MSEQPRQIKGLCDSGCGRQASEFFLETAVATCGHAECVVIQNERWIEHCAEIEAEFRAKQGRVLKFS